MNDTRSWSTFTDRQAFGLCQEPLVIDGSEGLDGLTADATQAFLGRSQ